MRIGARARVSSFAKHVRVRLGPVPRRPLADRRRVLLNGWARAKKSHASRRTLHCGMYSGFEENGRSTPSACARSFGLWLLYITLHSCSSSPSDCVMVPRPNLATGDDGNQNVAPRRNADLGATPAGRSPRALAPRSDPDDARSRRSTAGGVCPPPRRARLEDPRQCRLCGEPRGPRKPFRSASGFRFSVRVQLFEDQTRLTTNEPVWECNETRETRVPRILLVLLPYALDSPVPLALSNASAAAAAFAPSVVSAGVISLRPASAAPPPKKSTNDASVEEMPRSHASPAPAA